MERKIREPIIDGLFYPSDKDELTAYIRNLINESEAVPGKSFGILSPHAGYSYSGCFSAAAFIAASERDIKRVVVLSPVHREPENSIILTESKFFKTPLGRIEIDCDIIKQMAETSRQICINDIPHLEEHAIEVQLPFIQYFFPNASLIPVLLGKTTTSNVKTLSNALSSVFKNKIDDTLFVVSSNLSSYKQQNNAEEDCNLFIENIISKTWEQIIELYNKRMITACGAGCAASLLSFAPPEINGRVLLKGSSSSADNPDKVISYGAISFSIGE